MRELERVFEAGSILKSLEKCLWEGYFPQPMERVWMLRKQGKIPSVSYHTSTVFDNGLIRVATEREMSNIADFYAEGIRILYLSNLGDYEIGCEYDLRELGRFVGVKS